MKFRFIELFEHFFCNMVSQRGYESQLAFQIVVSGVVTRKRLCRNGQAGEPQLSNWRVDSLVRARQLRKFFTAVTHAVWKRPSVQGFSQDTSLAIVIIR